MSRTENLPSHEPALPVANGLVLTAFLLLAMATLPVFAQTSVSGNQSGTWNLAGSPYLVTDDVYVPSGQTLTIQPGVVVQFQGVEDGLLVDGTLVARGTAGQQILFTSDDAAKAVGQWEAIRFRDSSTDASCILEQCIIECGGANGTASENIEIVAASPVITNCTIRLGRQNGITLYASDARIENCTFQDNGDYALAMRADSLPVLRGNTGTGNGKNSEAVFGSSFSRTGTWTRDNLPYTIVQDLFISSGVTLTIEPGAIIQFEHVFDGLLVDGGLVARGTAALPIRFTSDDAVKAPGQWEGIRFRDTSIDTNCILDQCVIEYGGASSYSSENIEIAAASPVITNCVIRFSQKAGVSLYGADPHIENCSFQTNAEYALAMRADSLPVLRNNTAMGNTNNAHAVFGGSYTRTGTWTRDNLPYTIVQDLYISSGVAMTIEPGTTVQFEHPFDSLIVDGALIAAGTLANPIRFTSDDAIKSPGQWEAIRFRDGSSDTNCILDQCVIEYGGANGYALENIEVVAASPVITNCTIRFSQNRGISLYTADARIQNCLFQTNGSFALAMQADSLPVLRNNSATGNTNNAHAIFNGSFTRTGTWMRDTIPYTVVQDLYILSGTTLTIEPGTTIQFEDPYDGLFVDGSLIARGTAALPITFTSDDSVKAPGQWKGIHFRDGSIDTNCILDQCIVEYGGANGYSLENIEVVAASPVITNCTIRFSQTRGVSLYGANPHMENCAFQTNGSFGLAMQGDALPVLRNNSAVGNTNNAHAVFGGSFTRSGSWTRDAIPYTIVQDLYISSGVTMTLEPGTTIQFEHAFDALVVDGTLVAQGAPANPILFTSDDAVKAPGQWEAIYFRDSSDDTNCLLRDCVIEYGGGFAEGSLGLYSATPTVRDAIIRFSSSDGVFASSSATQLREMRLLGNGRDGLRVTGSIVPGITNSVIAGNTNAGVNNFVSGQIVKAEGNFWGHVSGPLDNANTDTLGLLNTNGLGDRVSEWVDWSPFIGNDPGTGGGSAPEIDVTPAQLNFGGLAVGMSSNLTVVITNAGSAGLVISNFAVSMPFGFSAPATPFIVAAGAQQSVSVTFTPTNTGPYSGSLEIVNNDADEPHFQVLLSGTATNPPALGEPGLRADYRFQNNLLSSVGNPPALTNLGGNFFVTTSVDGVPGIVMSFAANNGVVLQPGLSVVPSNVYSVVILAALDNVSLYRRVVGFAPVVSDPGLYVHNGRLSYWPMLDGSGTPVTPGAFVQLAITRSTNGVVRGYVDGARQFEFADPGGSAGPGANGVLRFFRDDGVEASAGKVARIRVYDLALTDAQVAALDRLAGSGIAAASPALTISLAGSNVVVAWPTNDPAFRLQSSPTLAPPGPWSTISNVPIVGNLYQAMVGATNNSRFFQLVKP